MSVDSDTKARSGPVPSGEAASPKSRLLVFARPARGNREANPYTYLLCEALDKVGCLVRDFTRRDGLLQRPDVIHLHFPQNEVLGGFGQALYKAFWLVLRLVVQHVRGTQIIWTAHDLGAHDQNNPRLEALVMGVLTRLADGVIYLGTSSQALVLEKWPRLAKVPSAIIPHGLYDVPEGGRLSQAEACARFDLPRTAPIVGFIGDIKPYKGLERIVQAFSELQPGEATLFVAGRFSTPPEYEADIRRRLDVLRARGHQVKLIDHRLDHDEIAVAMRACDLVALPYRRITNSGFAYLVLGLDRRILAPDLAVFRELQEELGQTWASCISGDWHGDALRSALAAPLSGDDFRRLEEFKGRRQWNVIAEQTLALYRRAPGSK